MKFSLHGVKVPHRKNTLNSTAVRMPAPNTVTLLTQMHIGKPSKPVVKVGDKVKVGTLIAEADGFVSAHVHSSVSGTVKKIEDVIMSSGSICKGIVIESDGEMALDEKIAPPVIDSKESLIQAIAESGSVGLGGAGFPTNVKFNVDVDKLEEIIINGAECEPYITSDNYTMTERANDIKLALSYFEKYLGVKKIIIGVEKNKPEAIRSMRSLAEQDGCLTVKVLPSIYPQGGEKVLIYHLTGKVVPMGKLPIDVGSIVVNCTTVAEIGRYISTGMPLIEKCVTVDGSAVSNPMNVIVPIGTSLADVFDFTGGFKEEPKKVIYGGPMMGTSVPSLNLPILKNNNAILAFNEKDSVGKKPEACIKCGRCVNACPFGINPPELAKAFADHDVEKMIKLGAETCMECGCCSFVCPANRPIVQNNKLIKAEIREYRNSKGKEAAK